MNVRPLNDFILVTIETAAEVSDKGVASANDPGAKTESVAPKARVVSLGQSNTGSIKIEGPDGIKTDLRVGDIVWVQKWEVAKAKINQKDHLFVKKEHILGVFKEDGGKEEKSK